MQAIHQISIMYLKKVRSKKMRLKIINSKKIYLKIMRLKSMRQISIKKKNNI